MKSSYVSVREIAEDLAVSRMTVYRLVEEGALPSIRVGRSIRIKRVDYDAYLNQSNQEDS